MKISLAKVPPQYDQSVIGKIVRDIESAFARVMNPGTRLAISATLDFAAPGAVPGFTDQTVAVPGVELGDVVLVGAPITAPAGFLPPIGFVSAADEITVRWTQVSGAAADPDGAGGSYNLDIWRH